MNLKQIEAAGLSFIANEIAANEATIVADLSPFNGKAVDELKGELDKVLPPVARAIVDAAIAADEPAAVAALTSGEKSACDFIVSAIRGEATKLSA